MKLSHHVVQLIPRWNKVIIPKDWITLKISDIGKIITGSTPLTSNSEFYGSDHIWVTPKDMNENKKIVSNSEKKLTKQGFNETRKIPIESILFVCIASIGKIAMTGVTLATNQQINSIVCKEHNSNFIYYQLLFNSNKIKSTHNIVAVPIINKTEFGKYKIALPESISEQQKIASILSNVDTLIENTQKIIDTTIKLKKGLMQKLFTQGIGHTKFRKVKSLFGKYEEIPEEWKSDFLKHFSYVTMGISPSIENCNRKKKGLPFYQGATDFGNIYPCPTMWCTNSKRIVEKNKILFTVRAPVGKINITKERSCLGRGVCSLDPLNNDMMYCYFLILYHKKRFSIYAQGTTYDGINREELINIKLPLTYNKKEQQKIASILSNIDSLIQLQRNNKEKLEHLKKSLMQKLLTGNVRVKI